MGNLKKSLCVLFVIINSVSNGQTSQNDTISAIQPASDSIVYSLMIMTDKMQQPLEAGDKIRLRLVGGKLKTHTITAIHENSFVIDNNITIDPKQIDDINKYKSVSSNKILGAVFLGVGLIVSAIGVGLYGTETISYLSSSSDDISESGYIATIIAGVVIQIGGTIGLAMPPHTYNLKKGAQLIFIQKHISK